MEAVKTKYWDAIKELAALKTPRPAKSAEAPKAEKPAEAPKPAAEAPVSAPVVEASA